MKSSGNSGLVALRVSSQQLSGVARKAAPSNLANFLSGRAKASDALLVTLVISFLAFLAACGGGGGGGTAAIAIALSNPPTSVQAGATAQLTAIVTNDSKNGGVTWSCAPASSCGSFNPATTASGTATTYTAPVATPTGGSVMVTATSVTDSSKSASISITISSATGISVAITNPPTSVQVGATAQLTATVTNDSSNGGVNWSCTPASACGSFNPTSTASGAATTYTAPATAPSGGSVTVTATSVTDNTKSANATITISSSSGGSLSLTAGTYVFLATGLDSAKHLFGVVGEVQLDGNGNVTAGEQDFSDGNGLNSPGATPDTISAGTYTVNATTGQGTMTLPTSDTKLGVNGTETLSITVVNSKHVLITEFDSSATASGSLDFQTLPSNGLAQGGWSFQDVGENNQASYSQGGVYTLNASSQATICPTTTTPCFPLSHIVTDFDENTSGGMRQVTMDDENGSGYFSAADATGRGQAFFGGIYWDYYIVGSEVVRMLGYFPQTGTFDQLYVGSAYGQGTTTYAAASLKGPFVFTDAGTVLSTNYAAAGQMSLDGTSVVSGFADVAEGTATPTSAAVAGSYQMNIGTSSANGYGRITISSGAQDIKTIGMYAVDPTLNISDPNNTTTSGQGALLVDLDQNVDGAGILLTQGATSGVAAGNYAVGSQVFSTAANGEVDLVGQAAANSSAVLTGTVDVNDAAFGTGKTPAAPFSVTLTADTTNAGRFTAPLSLTLGGNGQSFNLIFYQVSASEFVEVVTGTGVCGTGTLQSQ